MMHTIRVFCLVILPAAWAACTVSARAEEPSATCPGECCACQAPSPDHYVPAEKGLSPEWIQRLTAKGERKVYRGKELETIGMPCGGVCAGQLYVRGDGTLACWWIANNVYNTGVWWMPCEDRSVDYAFQTPLGEYRAAYRTYRPPSYVDQGFAIRVKADASEPQVATLDRDGFDDIGFIGEYPIASIEYCRKSKPALPVEVQAEVFSPFIPLSCRDSANPATILRYTVANTSQHPLEVSLAGWLQNAVCLELAKELKATSRGAVVRQAGLTSVQMDVTPPSDHPQCGDMAISALDPQATAVAGWKSKEAMLAELGQDGELSGPATAESPLGKDCVGAVCTRFRLSPGQRRAATFLVTWYFPNRRQNNRGTGWGTQPGVGQLVGNMYANWYRSSLDVARYVAENFDRLDRQTHLFRDKYYDTTLPYWFAQRVAMQISTLATETCQWWANGRFYGFEGVGCCHGTCNHVWHYEQATARLFPDLQRSMLEMQTFNPQTGFVAATGLIRYRGEGGDYWAADGQAGNILMALRQHQYSPDDQFLRRNWPAIRKAIEFLIQQDGNDDGLIEGVQPNTYDIDFFGANTMVGSLYLAALRAGEVMANVVGDQAFAQTCRRIYRSGSKLSVERLFDGEYFIQDVDLTKHPDWQYAHGCLSDQLLGQTWAHQLGLGYVYPPKYVRSALQSVWKYNWAPDVGPQIKAHRPEINYADPGEAGLLLCTWPKGPHLGLKSVRYRDTVWTGIEFQVAAGMIYEGMLTEGLSIVRAIHERYDAAKHNPWNLILCGDHYSRAMASWGCLLAASGYTYDGPAGRLGFAPRLSPEDFRAFFTAAEGWGNLEQKRETGRQLNRIELSWGSLRLKTLRLQLPRGAKLDKVSATAAGRPVACKAEQRDRRVTITLEEPLVLQATESLETEMGLSPGR